MRRNTSKSGFTLIELLVVIAIIAILAAILFPVFAQARAKARQISCTSNLKQNALAILSYVNDYDETYPLYDYVSRDSVSGSNCNFLYYEAIMPYQKSAGTLSCPQTPYAQDFQASWANYIAIAAFYNNSATTPSGIAVPTTVCTSSPTITWISYSVNDTIINFGPQTGNAYPWPYPTATGFTVNRTVGSIPYPDEQIVQYDGYMALAGGDYNTSAPYSNQNQQDGQCVAGNSLALGSHTGNMNASFADGHVKTVHCRPDATNGSDVSTQGQDSCIGMDGLTAFPMVYVAEGPWQNWPAIYGMAEQSTSGAWEQCTNCE